jgi:hypothetical protein
MQTSPITNCWGRVPAKPLLVRHTNIFLGRDGASYNHQAQLTSRSGVLIASWSQGLRDEDSPGQIVVCATSEDRGKSWSRPTTIVSRERGQFAELVRLNAGVLAGGDELVAYYGQWELSGDVVDSDGRIKGMETGEGAFFAALKAANGQRVPYATAIGHLKTVTWARTSNDFGRTWSPPIEIIPHLVSYHAPRAVASGRLIFPGNATFAYTDDPKGLTNWHRSALPRISENFVDGLEGWFFGREERGDPVIYSEGSFFQLPDGTIRMMLRTEADRLAVSESRDNGETWGEPMMTEYTDNIGRPCFGRLPDGRYYGINCPVPGSRRTPVVLALSRDGTVFDQHFIIGSEPSKGMRIDGYLKGGRYGYPWLHVDGEEAYVIYSVEKEDIAVGAFNLEKLGA